MRERRAHLLGGNSGRGVHSQGAYIPHVVVAVPDPGVESMLSHALSWYGYSRTCLLIDHLQPLGWIKAAVKQQPDAVIVDVDLFQHRSVQETILDVLHAWENESSLQPLGWVWLSRRPVEGSVVLRMPFHLAQLFAALRGQSRQESILSLSGTTRNGIYRMSHYD